MEKDTLRLREYVEELRALGVEPKSGTEGLVDFPALLNGRKVYLCWKLGESRVLFWHDLEAGLSGGNRCGRNGIPVRRGRRNPRNGWRRQPELRQATRENSSWLRRRDADSSYNRFRIVSVA